MVSGAGSEPVWTSVTLRSTAATPRSAGSRHVDGGAAYRAESRMVRSARTFSGVTGICTLAYSVVGTCSTTRPLTRNSIRPSGVSSMLSTPVMADGATPGGTGTTTVAVSVLVVSRVAGTGEVAAEAGVAERHQGAGRQRCGQRSGRQGAAASHANHPRGRGTRRGCPAR